MEWSPWIAGWENTVDDHATNGWPSIFADCIPTIVAFLWNYNCLLIGRNIVFRFWLLISLSSLTDFEFVGHCCLSTPMIKHHWSPLNTLHRPTRAPRVRSQVAPALLRAHRLRFDRQLSGAVPQRSAKDGPVKPGEEVADVTAEGLVKGYKVAFWLDLAASSTSRFLPPVQMPHHQTSLTPGRARRWRVMT